MGSRNECFIRSLLFNTNNGRIYGCFFFFFFSCWYSEKALPIGHCKPHYRHHGNNQIDSTSFALLESREKTWKLPKGWLAFFQLSPLSVRDWSRQAVMMSALLKLCCASFHTTWTQQHPSSVVQKTASAPNAYAFKVSTKRVGNLYLSCFVRNGNKSWVKNKLLSYVTVLSLTDEQESNAGTRDNIKLRPQDFI